MRPVRAGQRLALAAFVVQAMLTGGNAVAARFSNRELAPLWGAGLRFSLAAALLLAVTAALRLGFPRGRALTGAVLYGLFNFGGSLGLAYYALVWIHAGLAQTLLAVVPLATLLVAVAYGQERLRVDAVAGTLLALLGVALVSRAPLQAAVPPLSLLALLGSVFCFAHAAVVVRRFPRVHPVTINAVGMAVAAVFLVVASALAGEAHVVPHRLTTLLALAYVVPVGSVVVFLLYVFVLRYWSASRVAYGFVITPIVTVLLSAWLDNEPIGAGLLLGGALVLAGVYVGALRGQRAVEAN